MIISVQWFLCYGVGILGLRPPWQRKILFSYDKHLSSVFCRQYGGYEYSQQGGYVPPEMMQPQQPYTGQILQPTSAYTPSSSQSFYGSNFEDEPPLLEGLIFILCRISISAKIHVPNYKGVIID